MINFLIICALTSPGIIICQDPSQLCEYNFTSGTKMCLPEERKFLV